MILKFPDISLTFEYFLISLTILQNSLTLKKNQISLTGGHPDLSLRSMYCLFLSGCLHRFYCNPILSMRTRVTV